MRRHARTTTSILTVTLLAAVWAMAPAATAQDRTLIQASPEATPQATPVAGGVALLTLAQVPEGMVIIEDRERGLDEIVANFSDPADARQRFAAWGWERNAIRAFHTPEGAPADPARIDGIYVSIHVFGAPEAAVEALAYSRDVHAGAAGLDQVSVPEIGDSSHGLYGRVAYGNEVTIYVQRDRRLIRLSASSPEGDPRNDAFALMRTMLDGAPSA